MKRIAYLRVSTSDQCVDRQIDGLEQIADKLHVETVSAVGRSRPIFDRVIAGLHPGDMFVVWSLDRAFRSTVDAIIEADKLKARGIIFKIATLGIDTSTADGRLAYTCIAAVAQHERDRISERTRQGLEAARRRGRQLGRPPKLDNDELRAAHARIRVNREKVKDVADDYGVAGWTLKRGFQRLGLDSERPQL